MSVEVALELRELGAKRGWRVGPGRNCLRHLIKLLRSRVGRGCWGDWGKIRLRSGVAAAREIEESRHVLGATEIGGILESGETPGVRHSGVDGSGISIIVCITGDDLSGLVLAWWLVHPDAQRVVGRRIGHPDPGDVEPRDLDDRVGRSARSPGAGPRGCRVEPRRLDFA